MDSLSPDARSKRMSLIHARDTGPEMKVRRHLHASGLRYRLHRRDLPGKPDVVFSRHKVANFVHGCFWHAHHCQNGRIPATRSEFWKDKFRINRTRDAKNKRLLQASGWHVITVWECSLSTLPKANKRLDRLVRKVLSRPRTET